MTHDHDVIVIGGGIHGAGVAQAAAATGHSVLVLEQYPSLASGTSGRSSKLIHGGLRYLETASFALVRESLHERATLLRIAPDLVELRPFHIPVYRFSRRGPAKVRAGLSLYAALGGFHRDNFFRSLPSSAWPTLDGLTLEDLVAVFRYRDAQTDDGALTRAVMASARELGAELMLPARVDAATLDVDGVTVRFHRDDGDHEARGRVLVNAAGPWVNEVIARMTPRQTPLAIELIQGAHIVLPGRLEKGIYYVEAEDGRAIFAMPWRGNIMVGTTETRWTNGPASAHPLDAEISYLLAAFRRIFPGRAASRRDIVASFAGLRVLPAGADQPFLRSRDVILTTDRDGDREGDGREHGRRSKGRGDSLSPRLVSIYGGKLTTYRATAAKVMARLAGSLPARKARGDTRELRLAPVD